MAKTTAPLLSFGAAGAIAKTQVYSRWRGIPYARRYVVPANPQTAGQTLTRSTFAMLREMWKLNGTLGRAPWDLFATGRPFLGLNSFIGENVRVIRGETDMNLFIGSPGARGGIPATSIVASTGSGSGEVDLTFTNPTPPTDWTIDAEVGIAFPDQDPVDDFAGPLVEAESDPPTGTVTLAGLGSAVGCQAVGWLRWIKPDLSIAYSVGVTDQATSGA